ncbi:MAG TPA: Holliday junction resolvase RuvX [Candidatus Polarisedimenticolaceae bacterium]
MTVPAGRRLALDLGDRRIGLALSDPTGVLASPHGLIERRSWRRDVEAVAAIVREHEVVEVVVGWPRTLSGDVGERAQLAEEFAQRLRTRLGVPVVLWDERLTTVEAQRTLIAGGVRRERRRQVVDAMAASLILQGYLEAQRSSST